MYYYGGSNTSGCGCGCGNSHGMDSEMGGMY